jgi:hypothetical protein
VTAPLPVPPYQVLVEQSLLGWKEYELEVMRDLNDNCMIVCRRVGGGRRVWFGMVVGVVVGKGATSTATA